MNDLATIVGAQAVDAVEAGAAAVDVEVAVGAEGEGGETGGLEGGALGAEGGEGFVAGGGMVEDEDAVGVLMATDGAGRVAFDDVAHGSLFLIEQSASLCHRGFWLLGWRSTGETLDAYAKIGILGIFYYFRELSLAI